MYRQHLERDPIQPEIRVGEEVNAPTATTVRLEGRPAQSVRLKERLDVRSVRIHSVSNDNQRFFVRVGLGKMKPGTLVYLGFEGRWWWGGLGTTATDSEALFQVDRAAATAIAAAFSVAAFERSPLDGDLRHTWRFPEQVVQGEPATVTLHIANEGAAVAQLRYCPYWLELTATRDGSPVRTEALNYSGPSAICRVEPGASADLGADLREDMALDEPGRYEIDARFRAQLVRDDMPWKEANLSAAEWDVCWTGRGTVIVG